MTATYTFDVFTSLDSFGAHNGDWGGYWGKQGPELLKRRLALYGEEQRMVFGANTYRAFARMLASSTEESEVHDQSRKSLIDCCACGNVKEVAGREDTATTARADALHNPIGNRCEQRFHVSENSLCFSSIQGMRIPLCVVALQ
ncbi:hypothetical protein ACWGNA_12175 [Brucella cytisi]|uniref:hypothetical protein n=1 Tax=Brucella cytisi TaxID=407152 RepID=UPI0035E1BFCA